MRETERRSAADQRKRVGVGMVSAEELRNVATGLKRIYPVAEDHAFDDLLGALDRASRKLPTRGSSRV